MIADETQAFDVELAEHQTALYLLAHSAEIADDWARDT